MHLGNEIRKIRVDQGMKQQELWARAGITAKYMSEIENGYVDPRFSVMCRIAKALGVSLDRFMADTPPCKVPRRHRPPSGAHASHPEEGLPHDLS
jgi:transcriptional regulator with XRE-family HTH domain